MTWLDGKSLSKQPPTLQWGVLFCLTAVLVLLFDLVRLPAAMLLGAMGAGIIVAVYEGGHIRIAPAPFMAAQGLIGCLVARSLDATIFATIVQQWPVFLFGVCAVLVFSTVLGALLARWRVLPGTTAIWGATPGAATVMVLMSQEFGADSRLVAFMQFMRVIFVALVASLVARWVAPNGGARPTVHWFPPPDSATLATLAVALGGAWLGSRLKVPAGALLLPLLLGAVLASYQVVHITLPPWIMAICYALVGWAVGLRFTREVVRYVAEAFPRIAASTLLLIALCGGLGYLLHLMMGIDILSAYLATSPGGADSVAIIAASTKVDMPFIMAMQTARFLFVVAVGPALARLVARWADQRWRLVKDPA